MPTIGWIVFGVVITINVILLLIAPRIARKILENWATKSGYIIMSAQRRWLFAGPFSFRWNGQVVLRFRVRDERGEEISGWALCGGPGISFFTDRKIKVQLD